MKWKTYVKSFEGPTVDVMVGSVWNWLFLFVVKYICVDWFAIKYIDF